MCGFIQSTLVTVPVALNGFSRSNSAENEWWASIGAAVTSTPNAAAITAVLIFIEASVHLQSSSNSLHYRSPPDRRQLIDHEVGYSRPTIGPITISRPVI